MSGKQVTVGPPASILQRPSYKEYRAKRAPFEKTKFSFPCVLRFLESRGELHDKNSLTASGGGATGHLVTVHDRRPPTAQPKIGNRPIGPHPIPISPLRHVRQVGPSGDHLPGYEYVSDAFLPKLRR